MKKTFSMQGAAVALCLCLSFEVCAQTTGTITRHRFDGISGTEVGNLTGSANYPDSPSVADSLAVFEIPSDAADDYGTRVFGFLHPPTSGTYRFWISSDDNSELRLSTDETPERVRVVANVAEWTFPREWTKYSSQQSGDVYLDQDRFYYVEALHKEGGGGDNLAVAWTVPGRTGLEVIVSSEISPWEPLPPIAADDHATVRPNGLVGIPVAFNDREPNGVSDFDFSSLSITVPPASGSVTVDVSSCLVKYLHDGSPGMSDSFSYTIADQGGLTSGAATVHITIDGSTRIPADTLNMPAGLPSASYDVEIAYPGTWFNNPVAVATPPGETGRVFVVEKGGTIQVITNLAAGQTATFLTLSGINTSGEQGLLGLAFHPDYASNGYFYVFYTLNVGGLRHDRVSRFTVSGDPNAADAGSELPILQQRDEADNHNGGDLHFGPDGYLYIALGDEGGANDNYNNGQVIDNDFFAGIIRIDVDRQAGNLEPNAHPGVLTNALGEAYYSVPADNPLVGVTTTNPSATRTEFWAVGLRNPWRMSFDPLNGDLWIGDVGQGAWEEVDICRGGENFGWPNREGFASGPKSVPQPPGFTLTEPVHVYDHPTGLSISGGIVHRGTTLPELYGHYLFADYVTPNIWAFNPANSNVQVLAEESGVVGFGVDPATGDPLLVALWGGLLRLVKATESGNGDLPLKLSDTGAFADLQTLTPNPGILAYEPNVAFWSDHALKYRWFGITNVSDMVSFDRDDPWTFPGGMTWVKHFDLEMVRGNTATVERVETRVLVRNDDGAYGVSYRWDDGGSNAWLVADSGSNFNYVIDDGGSIVTQTWMIPGRSQCLVCHTPVGGHALSFNTRQLNRDGTLGGQVTNQVAALQQLGYLQGDIEAVHALPWFAPANDDSQSLEFRMRSYLAVNCISCHQPGGSAFQTWDARPYVTLTDTKLVNGEANDDGGNGSRKLVVPNATNLSILVHRISASGGFSRMPPLGTAELDDANIQLVVDWIMNEAGSHQAFGAWQTNLFGSSEAVGAGANDDPDGDGDINFVEFLNGTEATNALSRSDFGVSAGGGQAAVSFHRNAQAAYQVEISTNLQEWSLWDIPENRAVYSATSGAAAIEGAVPESDQLNFRLRVTEP